MDVFLQCLIFSFHLLTNFSTCASVLLSLTQQDILSLSQSNILQSLTSIEFTVTSFLPSACLTFGGIKTRYCLFLLQFLEESCSMKSTSYSLDLLLHVILLSHHQLNNHLMRYIHIALSLDCLLSSGPFCCCLICLFIYSQTSISNFFFISFDILIDKIVAVNFNIRINMYLIRLTLDFLVGGEQWIVPISSIRLEYWP